MPMPNQKRCSPYYFSLVCFGLFAISAFFISTPAEIAEGFVKIVFSRSLLITDYISVGGIGAAIFNAAVSGSFAVVCLLVTRVAPNGALVMVIWLIAGFSFFGKNIFNMPPIFIGVCLYAKFQKEPFSNFSLTALLSSALAPVVSQFAFMGRFHPVAELALGTGAGLLVGFLMPIITSAVTRVHGGYNLYNAGFAAGLIALFIVGLCNTFGLPIERSADQSVGNNLVFAIFLYGVSLCWLAWGFMLPGRSSLWGNYKKILRHSGRLVTDYYLLYGNASFVNVGALGILATTIVLLMGAQLNASAVAGIFTIMAFGTFGKHPANVLPVMGGAAFMAALGPEAFNSSGNICSILFSSGLAPIAGQYGWYWGIVAGILHMLIVSLVGGITGGLNLYNNGFAAGFVALVLVPVILAFRRGKKLRETEV